MTQACLGLMITGARLDSINLQLTQTGSAHAWHTVHRHTCTKNMLTLGIYYARCAIEKPVAQDTEMTPFEVLTLKDDQMRIFCLIGFQVLSNCYS